MHGFMKSKIFFAAFASILLSGNASALQQDNIQIYMKPDTVKSFELVLPDDLGVLPNGKVEYRLLMEPFAGTWSDLTERRHFSDENNTVIDSHEEWVRIEDPRGKGKDFLTFDVTDKDGTGGSPASTLRPKLRLSRRGRRSLLAFQLLSLHARSGADCRATHDTRFFLVRRLSGQ